MHCTDRPDAMEVINRGDERHITLRFAAHVQLSLLALPACRPSRPHPWPYSYLARPVNLEPRARDDPRIPNDVTENYEPRPRPRGEERRAARSLRSERDGRGLLMGEIKAGGGHAGTTASLAALSRYSWAGKPTDELCASRSPSRRDDSGFCLDSQPTSAVSLCDL